MPAMLNRYSRNAAAKSFRANGFVASGSEPHKRSSTARHEEDGRRGEEKSLRAERVARSGP
jgi:hypothetical protein